MEITDKHPMISSHSLQRFMWAFFCFMTYQNFNAKRTRQTHSWGQNKAPGTLHACTLSSGLIVLMWHSHGTYFIASKLWLIKMKIETFAQQSNFKQPEFCTVIALPAIFNNPFYDLIYKFKCKRKFGFELVKLHQPKLVLL